MQQNRNHQHQHRGGCLPGMYADLPTKRRRTRKTTQHTPDRVSSFDKNKPTLDKPPLFDYLASFKETPLIPLHLERQRNLVMERRGLGLRRGHSTQGVQNKDWFIDRNELVQPPFYTQTKHSNSNDPTQSVSIMASIVNSHPPLASDGAPTDLNTEIKMPYTNLRDVNALLPLDFPKREL